MPSYVVTGASRGLGVSAISFSWAHAHLYQFGLISSLSSNPNNTVIGFVRNAEAALDKVAKELSNRNNLHIVRGDLDDYQSLQAAFETTAKLTGGSLDCLVANAAVSSSSMDSLTDLGKDHIALDKEVVDIVRTNVIGNINLINLALPLLKKNQKGQKVIVISSGMGDPTFSADNEIFESSAYSISKAAVDMVVAKYHAEYKRQGILFMGICPGVVDTQSPSAPSPPPEVMAKVNAFFAKFTIYAPDWKGPDSVETSVNNVLGIVDRATVEENGGRTVSHFGNRQWL